ncbi:hypothetical protein GLAREA_04338 [Glarea lozoyensis ATCC 20868]|uniref:Uncharacterized protein n=1 Tax=Glarea lozoyensis (strain ATCC 20868 / MF5171) TaxID=1116229 RepID=S3CM11_GLAL2|nr:uncharacterized protein GLAREA_04338 [Glarea lozoyensis ATCC 20868]EPE27547.1 hypothetical protein GLAREA_04338 [Glarea lozoyensis ATCC 20868]
MSSTTPQTLHQPLRRNTPHHLQKRNWASQEAGVIVVFCIVFVVGCGLLALAIRNCLAKRRAKKAVIASRSEVQTPTSKRGKRG